MILFYISIIFLKKKISGLAKGSAPGKAVHDLQNYVKHTSIMLVTFSHHAYCTLFQLGMKGKGHIQVYCLVEQSKDVGIESPIQSAFCLIYVILSSTCLCVCLQLLKATNLDFTLNNNPEISGYQEAKSGLSQNTICCTQSGTNCTAEANAIPGIGLTLTEKNKMKKSG